MSESETKVHIFFENDICIEITLDRVLAPQIVEDLIYKMPFEGRAAHMRGEMKITLNLGRGNQKATKKVKRGDVAYMPLGDSLVIYTKDMTTFSQVNIIGTITSDDESITKLTTVRRGSQAELRFAE